MRLGVALSGCALVGCGSPWEPAPVELGERAYVSGSRLQVQVWAAEDGVETRLVDPRPLGTLGSGAPAPLLLPLYDRERQEECRFEPADDGTLRCFPADAARAFLDPYGGSGGVPFDFADAGCETEVYFVTRSEQLIAARPDQGCGPAHLYEMGALHDHYYRKTANGCEGPYGESYNWAQPGAAVSNDLFVKAAWTPAGKGDLRSLQLTAEDGTALRMGLYDAHHEQPCVDRFVGAELRCVEDGAPFGLPGRLSPECVPRVVSADACLSPVFGLAIDRDGVTVRELSPATSVEAPDSELRACLDELEELDRASLYAPPRERWLFGDAVPAESFPRLTWLEVGEELRIGGVAFGNEDDVPMLERGDLFDKQFGSFCTVREAADSVMRCMPRAWAHARYFADELCGEPLLDSSGHADLVGEVTHDAFFEWLDQEQRVHAMRLGERFEGDVVYERDGDDCVAIPSEDAEGPFYGAASEIEPSTFVEYRIERR